MAVTSTHRPPSLDMLMAAAPVPVISATTHRPVPTTRPLPAAVTDVHSRPVQPLPSRRPLSPPAPSVSVSVGVSVSSHLVDVSRCPGSEEEEPPVLRVTPRDLTYRGEGADHIVLRVIGKGQVVRLRKTAVGSVTSRENLILRATRDQEFLHNVARPILGPLLTDESRLAILDPETLTALKHTIEPRRQGYRQHKEINSHGVACICPDAASIFISRCDTSSSSSYVSSPSAFLTPSPQPCPLPPTSEPSSPSSSSTAAFVRSCCHPPVTTSLPSSLSPSVTALITVPSPSLPSPPSALYSPPSPSSSLPANALAATSSSSSSARTRHQVSIVFSAPPKESQGTNTKLNLRESLPEKSTNTSISDDPTSRVSSRGSPLEGDISVGNSSAKRASLDDDSILEAKLSSRDGLLERDSIIIRSTTRRNTLGVDAKLETTSTPKHDHVEGVTGPPTDRRVSLGLDKILETTPSFRNCPGASLTRKGTAGDARVVEATVSEAILAAGPKNVCIEIKPKQGFLDYSTPELPLCRYCVKQFVKRVKDGHRRSTYCPLDLFSGELKRMRRAVDGLMLSPQNNFKVFLDGEPVDDCRPFSYLRDVIIAALTFDFASGSAGIPQGPGALSSRSPLGRILAFQTLDQLGVFRAIGLYHDLVRRVGSSQAADATLQDLRCWTGDTQYCRAPRDLQDCTRCKEGDHHSTALRHIITRKRKHYLLKNGSRKTISTDSPVKTDKVINAAAADHVENSDGSLRTVDRRRVFVEKLDLGSVSSEGGDHLVRGGSKDTEDMSEEEVVRKLQEYLLSTTAKDLSLMILLSGPHTSSSQPSTGASTSPFIIELQKGIWFKCQVTGVDLVAKPSSKITKHEQDYQRLRDVLLELRSRDEEPICCRL